MSDATSIHVAHPRPAPRRRTIHRAAGVALGVFAAIAVIALATDNLHPVPPHVALTSGGVAVDGRSSGGLPGVGAGTFGLVAAPVGTPVAVQPGGGGVAEQGAGGVTTIGGSTIGGSSTATGGTSGGGPSGAVSQPGGPSTTTGPPSVAVASGVLKIAAFGSDIGLPLLCNVVVGGLGPILTNSEISTLAATITSSCVTSGSSGSAALLGLNGKLGALAAADPVLDPAINALAGAFNSAGSEPGVPFASSLIAISNIISFFDG